ncbi:pantoate--beta-alanine ligase [Mucilaginibacter ginsenosidivorans]|uniref:Pantothenate synthetase n=1 Tax=Mucilaginibacter ginsenosidivorans TaxID=398053 RepID=A0A5B8UQY4_9SPHI|nr:pantoate--beta-alanine ligase [Mucilaginibacter ginsenosidivorans]QEC61517.1 pantoate--beta-alanine ligase [Mucilaginibacter ginsenosidivorans]
MNTYTSRKGLSEYLGGLRGGNKTIGFVPTMGALHQGHLSLIAIAQQLCDVVVCSIFVNPTQFNDPKDLEKYPRPIQSDIEKLEQAGCDILFNPEVNEMYAGNEQWHLDLGELEHLLEGKFRPGHYQGVTQVVYKLFDILKPHLAFFGQKDYQQFLVIQKMVDMLSLPVKLVMCPILREPDGLAMSSRNIHLSAEDRQQALILSKTLKWLKESFNPGGIDALQKEGAAMISAEPGINLEYLEIVDGKSLHPATADSHPVVALVAAKVGATRLIDNIIVSD